MTETDEITEFDREQIRKGLDVMVELTGIPRAQLEDMTFAQFLRLVEEWFPPEP